MVRHTALIRAEDPVGQRVMEAHGNIANASLRSGGVPRWICARLTKKCVRPVVRDQPLQQVQLAGDRRWGVLMDADHNRGTGEAQEIQSSMDLWRGGHRPFTPFCMTETRQYIGAVVRAQEQPLERSGAIHFISIDQHTARGVPLARRLLRCPCDADERCFWKGLRRGNQRQRMTGKAGDRLTTEITDRGRGVAMKCAKQNNSSCAAMAKPS
jgi:hypothetical protein